MSHRHPIAALALAATVATTLAAAFAAPARADDVSLAANGQWSSFAVDALRDSSLAWIDDASSVLSYTFTIASGFVGTLDVVDAAFGGDTFRVTNFGSLLGSTSSVPLTDIGTAPDLGYDFDAAFADAGFSHGSFALGAGTYRISGSLEQSVLIDGTRLDATAGALRLNVSPIPEPSTYAMLLAGLGVVVLLARRRAD